jgi:hypothetical protein
MAVVVDSAAVSASEVPATEDDVLADNGMSL